MLEEKIVLKDEVWVIVEHRDGHVEVRHGKGESVVDAGLNWLAQRVYSDIPVKMGYGAVGTGTNTPQASDTQLQAEELRKPFSVASNPSLGKMHFEFIIDWTECNDKTLTEVGVFNAPDAGVMLLRKLLDVPIEKTGDKKLTIIVEVTLERKT